MDFLNKAYAQLADLFKSMTPGARITAALLLVVIVVSVVFLFNQQVSGPDAYLMGADPFSTSQLSAMEAAFGKAGLDGYQIEGSRIRVPRGQQAKYMAALAENNAFPSDFGDYLQKAVNSTGFSLTSAAQQEAAIKFARQRELKSIIDAMTGIEKSSVQIDEKTSRGGFPQPKSTITASVAILPKGNQPLDEGVVKGIRHLVASSVAGLKPDAVTVVDLKTGQIHAGGGGSDGKSGGLMNEYAELKQNYEKQFERKIGDLLSFIPGVVVRAGVELNPEINREEKSTRYDKNAVAYESRENTLNKTLDTGSPGGRPGLAAQGGVNAPAMVAAATGTKNNEDSSQTETRQAIPTTQTRTEFVGLTPKQVTVSVAIPSTYYEDVWRKQNPTPDGQEEKKPDAAALADIQKAENKKIQDGIKPLLGASAADEPQIAITTFYPTNQMASLAEPTLQDNALIWLGQNWSAVGMGGLALMGLMMLRSMIKAAPTAPIALASNLSEPVPSSTITITTETEAPKLKEGSARSRLKRRGDSAGPSLREELADIVREDPEVAVGILRTWIGSGS